jgi:hypothetical protein
VNVVNIRAMRGKQVLVQKQLLTRGRSTRSATGLRISTQVVGRAVFDDLA